MTAAPSLLQTARALIVRDVQLLWRRRGDALQPALFALLVVVLFALGLGTSPQALSKVAPAVLWVAVLLAGLLSLDTLFRGDAEDGSLEQWLLAPVPLAWLVAVRVFTHWTTTAVPLIVAVPFLGELLHLPRAQLPVLLVSLALGWRCRCTCRCWCSAPAASPPAPRVWMPPAPCCCSPPAWCWPRYWHPW